MRGYGILLNTLYHPIKGQGKVLSSYIFKTRHDYSYTRMDKKAISTARGFGQMASKLAHLSTLG